MLVYAAILGIAGGCAFWIFLAYILLHKRNEKRKIISAANFKAEAKKHESPSVAQSTKSTRAQKQESAAVPVKNKKGGKADV